MDADELARKVSAKVWMSFSIGRPVRIRHGMLAGFSGTFAESPASGRPAIKVQLGVYLEIDQSSLEAADADDLADPSRC